MIVTSSLRHGSIKISLQTVGPAALTVIVLAQCSGRAAEHVAYRKDLLFLHRLVLQYSLKQRE